VHPAVVVDVERLGVGGVRLDLVGEVVVER